MSASIKLLGIERLALEDRLDLVEQVWDSIAADSVALPLTDAQRIELERRVTDHEQNPDDVVSWDEIRSAASKHLP
jgi:putative addiction module component (TIGR02574 family)